MNYAKFAINYKTAAGCTPPRFNLIIQLLFFVLDFVLVKFKDFL